jgi:hypothetical protein
LVPELILVPNDAGLETRDVNGRKRVIRKVGESKGRDQKTQRLVKMNGKLAQITRKALETRRNDTKSTKGVPLRVRRGRKRTMADIKRRGNK